MLARWDLHSAVEELEAPLLILHAAGDEQVRVEHSRELAKHFRSDTSRLIVVPGGHHRSIQHDPELQAASVKFILAALSQEMAPRRHRGASHEHRTASHPASHEASHEASHPASHEFHRPT
ncbi:MAG: alpha/beta hydrolase family protein [Solirubrobacteraceae bacterium]